MLSPFFFSFFGWELFIENDNWVNLAARLDESNQQKERLFSKSSKALEIHAKQLL